MMNSLTPAQKALLNEVAEKDALLRHHQEVTSYMRSDQQVRRNNERILEARKELALAIADAKKAGIADRIIRMAQG